MKLGEYIKYVATGISRLTSQEAKILEAVEILANAVQEDRLLHVYGSEEESSSLITSQFFKAGKPISLNPMFDPSLDPAHGSYRNAMCMGVPGLAPCILDYYEYVDEGDPFILLGSEPTNIGFSESLAWAKKRGLRTITLSCSLALGADIALELGQESFSDGTYSTLASAMLEFMFKKVRASVPEKYIWDGNRFVDLECNKEKLTAVLYRVKHL